MCGIAGFIDKNKKFKSSQGQAIIKEMVGCIKHRGRDDQGFYNNDNIYLGHARLSILDLSSNGHQPMISEDQNEVLVYNGEVYNFEETKKQLNKYKFKTKTDTEVILKAYKEYGLLDSLSLHKGMFALALLDQSESILHLVVDRFSIKPLYYFENKDIIAFASEIKSLLKLSQIKAELNIESLPEYLYFRHLAGKNTMFKNIYKIEPASFISINLKNYKQSHKQYWFLDKKKIKAKDPQDRVEKMLYQSVKDHLISDAPVGLQLSGGVDSSLIASLAVKIKKTNFHSFSIGLKDDKWNEFKYSRAISKKLKTIHHEYVFTEKQFCQLLPKMTYHLDEPIDHSHSIPMHILAKRARKHVKVLLSGEGADEIFGGYRKYQEINSVMSDSEIINLTRFGDPDVLKRVINIKISSGFKAHQGILGRCKNLSNFDKLSILDQKTYLISLLLRQDKMGMAANVENRVPYLDHELVEFVFGLPVKNKIQKKETKIILKNIAQKYIPAEAIYRRKVGFGQPISAWLQNNKGLGAYLRLFNNEKRRFINYGELKKVIREHQSGQADHGQTLWLLLNLELWMRIFIDRQDYKLIWESLK